MRKIISIIATLGVVLTGLIPQVAYAGVEAGTAGQFTVGSVAPSVNTTTLYSNAGLTNVVTTITPQVTYYLKVTVSDANTVDDIGNLTVKIFYDAGGTDPLETTITTGNNTQAAIISWNKSGNSWGMNAGSGSTWAVVPGSCVLPTMSASTGDWVVAFYAGKVATASTNPANWDIHARATDSTSLTSGLYLRDITTLWYGQVTMGTANVNFGSVTPGTGFADNVNEVNSVSATFVSNGNYYEKVKSDATWIGSTHNATLDATGTTLNQKEFSLKAYNADTFASAVLVDTTGVIIDLDSITTEAGDVHGTNVLWLKTASTFPIDVYAGTITYIITIR